jgi:hypothetical protein
MLREFDLDAPTLHKKNRQNLRHQTRAVTALYERCFMPPPGTEKFWKLLVEIVPVVTKPDLRDLLGVLTLQIEANPEELLCAADSNKKKRLTLTWLMEGIRKAVSEKQWPNEPFEQAAKRVVELDYTNTRIWKKPLKSPDGALTAEIVIEQDVDETRLVSKFKEAGGKTCASFLLCSTMPSEFAFTPYLGKLEWVNNRTIRLKAKSGRKSWMATIPLAKNSNNP